MKIALIGSTGLLGRRFKSAATASGAQVVGIARSNADFLVDISVPTALESAIRSVCPDVVVNAAAIVNLVACEKDPGTAYCVNARPASILAGLASELDFYLVQISTDHYYSGDGSIKHAEDCSVKLLNEYARTKFAGEIFALMSSRCAVVRTNIVGFHGASTFVDWVVSELENEHPIKLFDDYFTSSIDTTSFSAILLDLIKLRPTGLINIASRDVFSKKRFVEELAASLNLSLKFASAGTVQDLEGPNRAESLGLDVNRAETILRYHLPTMNVVINQLLMQYTARRDPSAI